MSNNTYPSIATVDPWVGSSLLQKSIRRSDGRLASAAARALHQHRGKGVWRRLVNIAFEDVGIADPQLLLELSSVAADERMREAAGDERELLNEFCSRLAAAPKDRSADYLLAAALRWAPFSQDRVAIRTFDLQSKIDWLVSEDEPIARKAIAILDLLTVGGMGEIVLPHTDFQKTVAQISMTKFEGSLWNATLLAAKLRVHPVILMPILLNEALAVNASQGKIVRHDLGAPKFMGNVPLFAYDQYTSLGKRAIGHFVQECLEVREALRSNARDHCALPVARMAVFYAEGFKIRDQFQWEMSKRLEGLGRAADLTYLGALPSGIPAIIGCVNANLGQLCEIRSRLLSAGRRK